MTVSVEVENLTELEIETERWQALAIEVLTGEHVERGSCFVGFIEPEPMQQLNLQHMGKDYATDVLSFPIDAAPEQTEVPNLIGDVMVCPQVAVSQATGHGWAIDNEFGLLVVHGVLHLLGHDHEEPQERELMRSLEKKYLAAAGLEHKVFDDE